MNVEVIFEPILFFDTFIRLLVIKLSSPVADHIFKFITNFGSVWAFVILAAIISLLLIVNKKRIEAAFLVICLFTSWRLMLALKLIFGRERPAGEHLVIAKGLSFPSGHAMVSIAFYGFLVYLIATGSQNRWSRVVAALISIFILFIGISRIYLNVHYASDVIGGFLFGALVLLIFINIYKWVKVKLVSGRRW